MEVLRLLVQELGFDLLHQRLVHIEVVVDRLMDFSGRIEREVNVEQVEEQTTDLVFEGSAEIELDYEVEAFFRQLDLLFTFVEVIPVEDQEVLQVLLQFSVVQRALSFLEEDSLFL